MKNTCSKCGIEKSNSDVWCKDCRKDYDRLRYVENKNDRIQKVRLNNERCKQLAQEYVLSLKLKGCKYCPEKEPCCLDFHHKSDKTIEISNMMRRGHSLESIKKEIEKCELVCSNCHRKIHAGILVINWPVGLRVRSSASQAD